MVKTAPNAPVGGNTKPQPKKCINEAKRWCFTWNNYDDKSEGELQLCLTAPRKWIYAFECGKLGTKHIQGYIEFEKKLRPSTLGLSKKIHWEVAKGQRQANLEYCSKEGDYRTNLIVLYKPVCIREDQLYDWQKRYYEIFKKIPNNRHIHWIWDENGNTGKSEFCKFLHDKLGATLLDGKKTDMLYGAAEYPANIYTIDCSRMQEEFISYESIEKIKNGYWFAGKYESKAVRIGVPHVVVFANFEPCYSALSKDRWQVFDINKFNNLMKERKIIFGFDD